MQNRIVICPELQQALRQNVAPSLSIVLKKLRVAKVSQGLIPPPFLITL